MDSRFSVHSQGALPSLYFSHNSHGARATLWAFRASHHATVQGALAIHTWGGTFAWSWEHVPHRAFPA
jgi:hypothetical protein